jgi:PAS domain S-box-containing protein
MCHNPDGDSCRIPERSVLFQHKPDDFSAMTSPDDPRARFLSALGRPFVGDELFDAIPDIVFFLKDDLGRYVAVNQTLVERTGHQDKRDLIGRTAAEVFPGVLGVEIGEQDSAVIRSGAGLSGKLELHLYPDGSEGWCLTWKEPLRDANGRTVGLSGISRDLQPASTARPDMAGISRLIDHIQANLAEPMRLPMLARLAGLTQFQLDQRVQALFGVSTVQYLTRARINHACSLLRQAAEPIGQIALACGYGDQAAFTRQFRKSVGLTPSQYQKRHGR